MISISVADGAGLQNYDAVLEHIYNTHRATNTVKESWLNAMRKREAEYPTGIELEGYSIAIPHCDSEHANQPAIYWICPYISRHLLSLNPLQARCRRYSRGER